MVHFHVLIVYQILHRLLRYLLQLITLKHLTHVLFFSSLIYLISISKALLSYKVCHLLSLYTTPG